ncbi:MAG: chemotaxis protein CheC [Deltaproteobacteria bacterium]|nr:chemotaxis protein CheC [Deltaproteobacteria bacterium]MBW2382659.1 chemotaxis protein CheC [Deltaproteobacteria bacterium]
MKQSELNRLSELANIGAGHAASAFASLTDRTIWMDVPRVYEIGGMAPSHMALEDVDEEWSTGVFFEFDGCLEAVVGILFHAPASEAVVRRVVGIDSGDLAPHVIESALMEVGNILASHVASAIADTLGERLLPSIPTLAMNHAEAELGALVSHRDAEHPIRIECHLRDETGELSGLLVLIPESRSE